MRIKSLIVFFIASMSMSAIQALPEAGKTVPPSSGTQIQATSSIHAYKDERGCGQTDAINARFTPTLVGDGEKVIRLILHETIEQYEFDCADGVGGKVSVEATSFDDAYKTGTRLWSFSTRGWTGEEFKDANGQFYRVSMPGCCASSDTDVYFSLLNGTKLFESTVPLMEVELTDGNYVTGSRFFAAQDNATSLQEDFAAVAGAKDAVAVIYLGTDRGSTESVVIHRNADDETHVDALMLMVDGKLAGHNSTSEQRFLSPDPYKEGHGVSLKGKLEFMGGDEAEFEIPVIGGHLSAAGAKSADGKVKFSTGKPLPV